MMGAEFILMYNLVMYRYSTTLIIGQYNDKVICEKVLESQKLAIKRDTAYNPTYYCLPTHILKNN